MVEKSKGRATVPLNNESASDLDPRKKMYERIKFDYKSLVYQIVGKASNAMGDLTWRHVKKRRDDSEPA